MRVLLALMTGLVMTGLLLISLGLPYAPPPYLDPAPDAPTSLPMEEKR